jgi:von Willebrand factor type D domain
MTVAVPATYNGKLDGVCGNGDGNSDNDLTTADGLDVRNDANAFNLVGDSYVVPDPEQPDLS